MMPMKTIKDLSLLTSLFFATAFLFSCTPYNIKGRVTADGKPLKDVLISDGIEIVKTNARGRYYLNSEKLDSSVFVITPSNYVAISKDGVQPGFWHRLSGDINEKEICNFELKYEDQTNYSIMFMPDAHLINDPRRNDIQRFKEQLVPVFREQAEQRSANGPVYTVNLGDFTHELFWEEMNYNGIDGYEEMKRVEFPTLIYSVMGNHDNDGGIVGENVDARAAHLFRKVWGPTNYSVNIGGDHWLMLDDVIYINTEGEGKKAPGVRGARDYDAGFTNTTLEWIKKDLEYVCSETDVNICVHIPLINKGKKDDLMIPKEQMDVLDSLLSKFERVNIFSGHVHRCSYQDHPHYTRFMQYCIPATSANMWECAEDEHLLGSDGTDAGVAVASFSEDSFDMSYHTSVYGEQYMRIYDMNEVGKYYRTDKDIKWLLKRYPLRPNYADSKYRNQVLINYWTKEPSHIIEAYEEGKALEVIKTKDEDPIYNISYYIPYLKREGFEKGYKKRDTKNSNPHMFAVKTNSGKNDVEILIKDEDGNIIHSKTIERPLTFSPEL